MARTRPAVFGRDFLRGLWRLTRLYWTSPDARRGRLLLAVAVALELASVYGAFVLADAQRRIFDALGARDTSAFLAGIGLFVGVVLGFVLVSTYRIYVRQILEIRWRGWLTDHFLAAWIHPHACCQMELVTAAADNPDQRIAEDVRNYVASALGLSLSLLAAVATLVSFAGLLYTLSGDWPIRIAGADVRIPGFMMWVAIAYALLATWIAHRVGRPLVPINFDRLRLEADFRFGLVRFRENAEAIALAEGDARERGAAHERFERVVTNWWELIRAQRTLTLFTTGIGQANQAIPLLVAAPGYFLGKLTLGSVAQTGIAYGQVSGALTWFVSAYQEIALWRASIERLLTFAGELETAEARLARPEAVRVEDAADGSLHLRNLSLALPDGRVLLADANGTIPPGERLVVMGPSGAGQTILLRALAGHWPFGSGSVQIPRGARPFFLSQRPYLPIGSLRAAVAYPAPETTFSDDRLRDALRSVDLGALAGKLDDVDHWEKRLSGGEQQRLAFARALLHEPDWIFLDDATAELDEETEARAYRLLAERLPKATLVSIAHRPAVAKFHRRRWSLVPRAGAGATLEAA
jgi:vitamin B12/bleomycin/antimicrobial peptide transport system ATP-binding/permease protein